jgi:acyl-homoserine-lactone acylase
LAALLALGSFRVARCDTAASSRWRNEAGAVNIVRDQWGIAHIYGRSDGDAVFGALYAQAEDDFHRIERNYLIALGRLAESEGESAIYSDLRQRLFFGPEQFAGAIPAHPAMAEILIGGLGRWLEFLPRNTSRRKARRHPAFRALDGAVLHRRQHRRGHRIGRSGQA